MNDAVSLTVGSLFAGIGGFDLGFERCGMRTLWQVEREPFCQAVLAKHFPDAQRFDDVCTVGAHNLEPVDLICGGFPCQDISLVGKGAGIDGSRSGLWAEYARIVRELEPRWVVVENVPALTSRGLDRVLRDLAEIGYDAEWDCLPASAFGAPHRRDRIWLVAYADGSRGGESVGQRPEVEGPEQPSGDGPIRAMADAARDAQARSGAPTGAERKRAGTGGQRSGAPVMADPDLGAQGAGSDAGGPADDGRGRRPLDGGGKSGDVPDPDQHRREEGLRESAGPDERPRTADSFGGGQRGADQRRSLHDAHGGRHRPPQGEVRPGRDGPVGAGWWGTEPDVGRVADGVPARVDRLSALGNALVPQIAEWIGRRILEFEEERVST